MKRAIICVTPAVIMLLAALHAGAAQPQHVLKAVFEDGRSKRSAARLVTFMLNGGPFYAHVNGILPDGTRVSTPAGIAVEIARTDSKATFIISPGSSVTLTATTANGELLNQDDGRASYTVVSNVLDFFNVTFRRITASVHGTVFSVDAGKKSITFACKRGEVNITKAGYLLIGAKRIPTSLVDVISPGGRRQVSYQRNALSDLGSFANFAQAEAFFQQQLAVAQRSGDGGAVNAARMNLGHVQMLEGPYDKAGESYGRAFAFYRQRGDREGEADALQGIGLLEKVQGHYADALQSHQQALALFHELGDRDGEARALAGVGNVQESQKHHADALGSFQQALVLFREIGDRDGQARVLDDIGVVELNQGRYAEELQSHQQALTLFRKSGDRDGAAGALNGIGNAQFERHEYARALQAYQQAFALLRELGDRNGEARALANIGNIQEEEGRWAEALRSQEQALPLFQLGDPAGEADDLSNIGDAEAKLGHYAEAVHSYELARALYLQLDDQSDATEETQSIEGVQALVHGAASPSPTP